MPTGYTYKIAEGVSFKEFALLCARNFGACIEMRDDPMDASIPDKFEPSDYHSKALAEGEAELSRVMAMTDAECEAEALKEYQSSLDFHRESLRKTAELKRKYEAMLEKVKSWNPPSKDHIGLRDFMMEQITESIKFDCCTDYSTMALSEEVKPSSSEWRAQAISRLEQSIAGHKRGFAEDVERAESRTRWVKQLRESL